MTLVHLAHTRNFPSLERGTGPSRAQCVNNYTLSINGTNLNGQDGSLHEVPDYRYDLERDVIY